MITAAIKIFAVVFAAAFIFLMAIVVNVPAGQLTEWQKYNAGLFIVVMFLSAALIVVLFVGSFVFG